MHLLNENESFNELQQGNELAKIQLEKLNYNMTMSVLPVTILIGFECLVGLVGNILILLVYPFRYEKSNFRYFVVSMAVVDLTSCLTTLPGEIFSQMNWYTYEYAWICKVKSYFNVLTAWASASILFGLAFDRDVTRTTHIFLFGLTSVVIAMVLASPVTVLWGKQGYVYVDGLLMINVTVCEKSGRYANEIYPLLYIACVYVPIGIMMCVVCALNVLTAKTLFCGMRDLHRGLYKYSSASTLRSVISTVSFGIFPENKSPTCKTTETDAEITTQFNSLCTNSDIWIDTCGQDCPNNNKVIKQTQSSTNSTNTSVIVKAVSDKDKATHSAHFTNRGKPDESSVTINTCSSSDCSSRVTFSISRDSSSASVSTDSIRCLAYSGNRSPDASDNKRKRKTVIMLVLTSVFVVTMFMYIIMLSLVAGSDGTLKTLSNSEKVWFFLFWRMYFVNCLVNPVLYGFLDPRFRSGLRIIFRRK